MSQLFVRAAFELLRRQDEETDPDDQPEAGDQEINSSWALFILIMLLISALLTSYVLQQRKIQAIHETVASIFAGVFVGLIIRIVSITSISDIVSFDAQFFFNLLLPPIILASGYELHQANFFRNIGTILTFAFAGTFISALSLALILWLWTRLNIDGLRPTFVETFAVGATLSATDPVTILAIFNLYKVEPKLYTIIFGESILNDAIAIVLFETAQKYITGATEGSLTILSLFGAIQKFLVVFFSSLLIGVIVGIGTALILKYTFIRRFHKIEGCLIVLIAYASYFFSNSVELSGIVSLLFCGITLKHYAYYNMSRRTQLSTKFVFQMLAQLSENFIFIYLGLTLFTQQDLSFKPLFILVTLAGICVARYLAVFPLSKAINYIIRWRARRKGQEVAEELPWHYQAMLFWAGLRGAVGVALAARLVGPYGPALRATVLVAVVLTVIIFGGTTAQMLDILGIRTGVVEEIDSDDEFDIETTNSGTYYRRSGTAFGHNPKPSSIGLDQVGSRGINGEAKGRFSQRSLARGYSSSNRHSPSSRDRKGMARKSSALSQRERDRERFDQQGNLLAGRSGPPSEDEDAEDDLDLPPVAPRRKPSTPSADISSPDTEYLHGGSGYGQDGNLLSPDNAPEAHANSSAEGGRLAGIRNLLSGVTNDHTAWFKQLDEDYIKPHLLLDQNQGKGPPV